MPLALARIVFSWGDATYKAVREVLELGYRSIDTAKYYENEHDVGRAVRDAKLQETVQITTKIS